MEFVTQPSSTYDQVFTSMSQIRTWVKNFLAVPVVMPPNKLSPSSGQTEEAKKEQAERKHQPELSSIDQRALVAKAAKQWGVNEGMIDALIEKYGLLAV